eukprot:INCI17272.1.p1 GENE.INCI17272.1~~INCI17272.1.p1  ORF type:complete len:414 (+),score=53.27 INCI17272.1:94-1335(+)
MSKVKTKKKGHPPLRAARPHDNLKASLSTSTELGRSVLEAMETDGYLVLRSVLSREECDEQVERLWEFVEATSPGVRRDRPDTWYPDAAAEVPRDPWPHSGWGNLPDMCQSFQGGWLFSDIREKLAKRVFELMYNTRELHSSKEGFTFHRPTSTSSLVSDPARFRHPGIDRARPRVCGRESHTNGEHFDQRALDTGLQCIQSSTALLDQTQSDGCFLCWPGSHRLHPQITKDIWRGRSDWVPLTDEELVVLRDHGYEPRKVPVQAGDVILWRSDLCHCGVGPSTTNAAGHSVSSDPGVTTFRAVSYTCMLPACLTDQGECPAPAQAIATIENPDKKAQNPAAARAESTAAAPVVLVGSEAMLARKFSEYINMLTGDHRPDLPSMPHMQVCCAEQIEWRCIFLWQTKFVEDRWL